VPQEAGEAEASAAVEAGTVAVAVSAALVVADIAGAVAALAEEVVGRITLWCCLFAMGNSFIKSFECIAIFRQEVRRT